MRVDIESMRWGAALMYNAAGFAMEGAQYLHQSKLPATAFGDFSAAEAFHTTISTVHKDHHTSLANHQQWLDVLGDKTNYAATIFVDTEEHNAHALKTVLCTNTRS